MEEYNLLRVPAVLNITGFSERTLFRKVKNQSFPQPIVLAKDTLGRSRLSAWRISDIQNWICNL